MDLDESALLDLAQRLRTGPSQHLNASELRAALAWVSGREGRAGSGLARVLGPPEADPDLLWQVYQQLDRLLFGQDRLREDAFWQGGIKVLMRPLSAHPRENRNQGREWFRLTYTRIFSRSDLRELAIHRVEAEPDGAAWTVSGPFELAVHYPGGRKVQASGSIRYRIIQKNQEWLIAGIDY
nr:hypothetical protein [Thioalkalivibrio sp.]